jgi:hypothetical protein
MNPFPRSERRSSEDEISRLFALMMPERAAKPQRGVAAAVVHVHREVAEPLAAERERTADLHATLLAAIAQDRARRRRHEHVAHVVLIAAFLIVAAPVLGVWVAKLLMPLALAR